MSMLRFYGRYKYFTLFSAGIDFRRQILTSKVDPRAIVIFIHCKSNSRLAVDEDDLKWVADEKKILLIKHSHEHFLNPPRF